jgi:hypothetical protein
MVMCDELVERTPEATLQLETTITMSIADAQHAKKKAKRETQRSANVAQDSPPFSISVSSVGLVSCLVDTGPIPTWADVSLVQSSSPANTAIHSEFNGKSAESRNYNVNANALGHDVMGGTVSRLLAMVIIDALEVR